MPDGEYSLGGQAVTKNGSHATLHDGTLAGSATDLMGCMKVAATNGLAARGVCALRRKTPHARLACSTSAAVSTRALPTVLLNADLNVAGVILRGKHSLTCSKIASNVATIYARLRVDVQCDALRPGLF